MCKELIDKLVDYLATEYPYNEAIEQAETAKFETLPNIIKITYDNGVVEYVVDNNGVFEKSHINPEPYSPYCELCESCGEDGCCSHISCFSTLVKHPKCAYGETYVKEAILSKELAELACNLIDKLKSDSSYTKEQFLDEFELKSDVLYTKRYNNE